MTKEELLTVLQQLSGVTKFLLDHPLLVGLLARVLSRLERGETDHRAIVLEELEHG